MNDVYWINNFAKIGGAAVTINVQNTVNNMFGVFNNHWFIDNLSPFAPAFWINDNVHSMLLFNKRDDKYSIGIDINNTVATNKEAFTMESINIGNTVIDYDDIDIFYLRLFISPQNQKIYSKPFKWKDDEIALFLCDTAQYYDCTKISSLNEDFTFPELLILERDRSQTIDFGVDAQFYLEINASSFFNSLEYSDIFESSQVYTIDFTIYGVIQDADDSNDNNIFMINMDHVSISNSSAQKSVVIPGEINTITRQENLGFGAIYIEIKDCSVNITITNSIWNNNTAAIGSSLAFRSSHNNNNLTNSIMCSNCVFNNNFAEISAPIIAASFVSIFFDDSTFYNSTSEGDSGLIYAINSVLEISSSNISNTTCQTNGGILLDHSKYIMRQTQCKNNVATYGRGACVYMMDISRFVMFQTPNLIASTDILQIDQCQFNQNYAKKGGAAIYINTDYDINELQSQTVTTTTTRRRLQTNKSDVIAVTIDYDFHREDISWTITSIDDDGTLIANGDFMGNESIDILNENCVKFTIYDEYGDGLNNGEGNWLVSWNDYDFYSPSNGRYTLSETLIICDPQKWNSTNTTNVAFVVSFDEESSFRLLKVYESIKDTFLNILFPKLMFTNLNTSYYLRLQVIACLFEYPQLSTVYSWSDFWNNATMDIMNLTDCPLSINDLVIENSSQNVMTPSINGIHIQDIDTLYDYLYNSQYSDLNMSSQCDLTYLNNKTTIETLCAVFSNSSALYYTPAICEPASCPASFVCDTNSININYKFENIAHSLHSESYGFDVPFYPLYSKSTEKLSLFGSYPFTECVSPTDVFDGMNVSNTVSVIVTASKCGDSVSTIHELQQQGVRGVIVYNSNYSEIQASSSDPKASFLRNILIINCLIEMENVASTFAESLRVAVTQLLKGNATINNASATDIGIEYEIEVDITNQGTEKYQYLQSSNYLRTLSKALITYLKHIDDININGITIYQIIETTDLPTPSPSTSPTLEPTLSPTPPPTRIYTTIRKIDSDDESANEFIERLYANDGNISLSFDCSNVSDTLSPTGNVDTLSPTNIPTMSPTQTEINANETIDDTVLIQFFDDEGQFVFEWLLSGFAKPQDAEYMEYIYSFCGWSDNDITTNIVVDTLFLTAKYMCIKYQGTILQLKEEEINSSSISFTALLTESEVGVGRCQNSSFIDLTHDNNNNSNINAIGTYCSKIIPLGGNEFELQYKRLYEFVDEAMITITNTTFFNNIGENGDGGAITILSEANYNDYITVSISDSQFESNDVGVNNSSAGGALYRAFNNEYDDGYNYISSLDLFNVEWIQNRATFGGALSFHQTLTDDGNIFKSLIRISNNLFFANDASYGASIYANGGNMFIVNTQFVANIASNSGGALYVNSSGLTLSYVNITDNVAVNEGGGIYNTEYPQNINLIICLGFYNIYFHGNNATESFGGAFYLNIVGEDEESELKADCLKVSNNEFSSNNDIDGNQVFLNLTEGVLAPFVREEWCSDDPEICETFTTSLTYLCMQEDSIRDGPCDILQNILDDESLRMDDDNNSVTPSQYIENEFDKNGVEWIKYQPVLELNPGASVILEIYGWDNFANPISTDKYDVELNDTNPVIFTSKANKFDRSAWVLPLFVDKGSVGQKGKGALIDPSNVVDVLPSATVHVVPCDDGYYQQTDQNDDELFTCTPCVYSMYSMNTMECNACEVGMKCAGTNQTYILSGYYGIENDDGTISTQRCPEGYCCAHPIEYNVTTGCLFDPDGRTDLIDPKLLCGNNTNRNWKSNLCGDCLPGYSETSSQTGQCLVCTDSSGIWSVLLPNIAGLFLIAFYMYKGLSPQNIDEPFIVYTTKSALYVFQLLPYLTFQSTVDIIAPVAKLFSFSIDMFSGSSADCIIENMDGRTKLSLGLLPGACYAFQLFGVWIIITIWKSYKAKQAFDAKADREEQEQEQEHVLQQQQQGEQGEQGEQEQQKTTQLQPKQTADFVFDEKYGHALTHTVWNIVLVVYAQITATLVKLIDCRPLGDENVMFYQGSVKCWDWMHSICYFFLFCCFIFPFYVIFILFRTRRRFGMGYLRRSYPSLVMNYRKDCWWFTSFDLFRRFLIIFISSLPMERSDITSSFLAIIVGGIFGFQLFMQPMHWSVNNYGETYVWFIALSICTLNIIDLSSTQSDDETHPLLILMTLLVFSLFVPMMILVVPFVEGKLPWTFHCKKHDGNNENENDDAKQSEDEDEDEEKDEDEDEEKDKDEDEDKEPQIFKQFECPCGYQLTLKTKIKTEKEVIQFDKEHFEALRQKKLNPVDAVQQELDEWLFTENEISNHNKTKDIQSHDLSVSSEEKEIHKKQIMEQTVNEMLENEDVAIFSPDELVEIAQKDEIEHTPVIHDNGNQKVLTDAWNNKIL